MIWILVLVLIGASVVFGPTWREVQEHETLADVLEQVSGKQYLERHVSVTTSKDEHGSTHAAALNQPLLSFYAYGDRFVKFVVAPEAPPQKETVNAFTFTVLMASQHAKHLPSKHDPVQNNKQLLFNDLHVLLRESEVGFRADEIDGIGLSFMNAVVDALWYIDGQYGKFESRHKHGKVPVIPDIFVRFNKGDESNKGGYNDWVAKRRKPPQMEEKELMERANKLITVTSHPRLSTS